MPEPPLVDFLAHLEASNLLTETQLAAARSETVDASSVVLAKQLVTAGLLTPHRQVSGSGHIEQ